MPLGEAIVCQNMPCFVTQRDRDARPGPFLSAGGNVDFSIGTCP
jgi:hypothetical protein